MLKYKLTKQERYATAVYPWYESTDINIHSPIAFIYKNTAI